MYALIISTDGDDTVHIGSQIKIEKKALEVIRGCIDLDSASWENFGKLDVEKLLMEALEYSEVDSAMELFSDISDARGDMVFMRIVKASLEMDA